MLHMLHMLHACGILLVRSFLQWRRSTPGPSGGGNFGFIVLGGGFVFKQLEDGVVIGPKKSTFAGPSVNTLVCGVGRPEVGRAYWMNITGHATTASTASNKVPACLSIGPFGFGSFRAGLCLTMRFLLMKFECSQLLFRIFPLYLSV